MGVAFPTTPFCRAKLVHTPSPQSLDPSYSPGHGHANDSVYPAGSLLSTLPGHLYSNQSCPLRVPQHLLWPPIVCRKETLASDWACLHFSDIRVVGQLFLGWRRRNYKGFQVRSKKDFIGNLEMLSPTLDSNGGPHNVHTVLTS